MGGITRSPDTSAMERQISQQRKENERLKKETEAEKAALAKREASMRTARTRGGSRALLSAARVSPEAGIQTLGSTGIERMS